MIAKIASFFPSIVVPIVVNFVLILIYARILSPAEYGEYSIYIGSVGVVYALMAGFLQAAAFRFYSMKGTYSNDSEYLSTFVLGNIAVCLLACLVLFVGSFFADYDWMVISFAIVLTALYQFFLNWYRLRDSVRGFAFGRLSAAFGALGGILVAMAAFDDAHFTVPIYTFYGAYSMLIALGLFSTLRRISFRAFSWDLFSRAFKYGMPMSGVSVITLLVPYGAQFAILFYLSQSDVGAYSLSFRLSDATLANVTMLILTVMSPAVMRAYDSDRGGLGTSSRVMLTKIISLNSWTTIPIAFAFALVAHPLISIVFPDYVGAEAVLIWIVFASALRSLSMITVKGLELAGFTSLLFVLSVLAAVVNVLYVIAFLPVYGLAAAAHASFISYLLLNIALVVASRKAARVVIDFAYMSKVVGASIISTLIAFAWAALVPVQDIASLILNLAIFGIAYVLLSIVLRLHRGFAVSF